MARKKSKIFKIILFVVLFGAIAFFSVNWFMTYRLEKYLRGILSERVTAATDGFYRLSFDHLSVGLFSGELTVKGVDLQPDSATFEQWASIDSLPATYLKLHFESIEFKGINLTWMLSRTELHFHSFELSSPDVEIVAPQASYRREKKSKHTESKTLYEMVSPYMKAVSVEKINLNNANIVYRIDDPIVPAVYSLRDVSFHAYRFLLDENSSNSGKLLLCDDFEFVTNQPQTLLSDNQFLINADNIRLSTQDSIISIKNVGLTPKQTFTDTLNIPKGNYIDAKVKDIEAKGIWFQRKNFDNYLDAHSFIIKSSDIDYISVRDNNEEKPKIRNKQKVLRIDSIAANWSLYSIISPIFTSVSIDKIGLADTKFIYTQTNKIDTDVYTLSKLDFQANGFRLDSLSDINNNFMYSMSFKLEAADMQGNMKSKNHNLNIENVLLDTESGVFSVNNVHLSPINTRTRVDYMSGSIDTIQFSGLKYDGNGVYGERFLIDKPNIQYVRNARPKAMDKTTNQPSVQIKDSIDIFDIFTSTIGELKIKNIRLRNANIALHDNIANDKNTYKLNNLSFYATDFTINKDTRNSIFGFFTCTNLGFNLYRFDNYIADKSYRLQIKQASFSHLSNKLQLKEIKLIPQVKNWKTIPDTYFGVNIPAIEIQGIKHNDKTITTSAINIESPEFDIVKTKGNQSKTNKSPVQKGNDFPLDNILVGVVNINDIKFNHSDQTTDDKIQANIKALRLKEIGWQNENIKLDNLNINNISVQIDRQDIKAESNIKSFTLSDFHWDMDEKSLFNIGKIILNDPTATIELKESKKTAPSQQSGSKDLYSQTANIADKISVGKISLTNGNFEFVTDPKSKMILDKVNKLNLDVDKLSINSQEKTTSVDDIRFNASDFSFPLDNGFYTLKIDSIGFAQKASELKVSNIHLDARYPKTEFAYKHPKNKDWFDVTVGSVSLKGIDIDNYLKTKTLTADHLEINKTVLQNFKNQNIEIEHNIMPMIYEGLQKAPIRLNIPKANVNDFSVIYEELTKGAKTPGKISFMHMNAGISGLTNIVSQPDQYITLDANGKFMGTAHFDATWKVPVDSMNDRFYLDARIQPFDLRILNELANPMAPVTIESGLAKETAFNMNATSMGGYIRMTFLYNDLKINILKTSDEGIQPNKFATTMVSKLLKKDNPKKIGAKPRLSDIYVDRDPYHSTFNYFWQILQPAMGESVGVSQGKQNFAKSVMKRFNAIKSFFSGKKKKKTEEGK